MCNIYACTDPILYESRARSIRISGVVTSIKLENQFWDILTQLAKEEDTTTNRLIAQLYDEVYAIENEVRNFTSFLRVTCIRYLELRRGSLHEVRSVLDRTRKPQALQPGLDTPAVPHGTP
ncbi:MAG: ribbon-helix-helix domain-containing protein [Castellaniella sp.]|nr:ribbon-helix-helix domain-containing protein [Castellaniella sp.]